VRATLFAGISAISVWFWFKGIHNFRATECRTWISLLVKVDAYGQGKMVYQVFSVIEAWPSAFLSLMLPSMAAILALGFLMCNQAKMLRFLGLSEEQADEGIGILLIKYFVAEAPLSDNEVISKNNHPYNMMFYQYISR
jgi:hypothetical protein